MPFCLINYAMRHSKQLSANLSNIVMIKSIDKSEVKMNTNKFGDFDDKYSDYNNSKIIILPVPYDETSTWMKGANKGPEAIIEASVYLELYDIETDKEVYLNGIYTAPQDEYNKLPEIMVQQVKKKVSTYLKDNKFVVSLGGEHSISIGAIYAHLEKYPEMTVLQLDAHSDLRDEYHGSKYNHACVMARAIEKCEAVQVGIRSMDITEKKNIRPEKMFYCEDIIKKNNWMDEIIKELNNNVYITIDLDVFDPSIMPATGTPEPGGMLWYDVLNLLKNVSDKKNIVGFDVVELCPNKFVKHSDFFAAKLIYKLLGYIF
jgi:agmatinase